MPEPDETPTPLSMEVALMQTSDPIQMLVSRTAAENTHSADLLAGARKN